MRRLITIAGSLVLAGCGSEPMSPEEVLGQADALERPAPGLYRTEAKLLSFEMPGIAPADADRFRNRMAGLAAQPQQQCLTPEEAERGFEDLLRTIGEDVNGLTCAFEDFATDPPALDAVLACQGSGMEARIGFDGTADADGLDLEMAMDASTPLIPGQSMKLVFDVSSKRVGECPAAQ